MIDIAWSEFLLIALIALILIGPKELPFVLRSIGRWIGKARAFARDLCAQLDLHDEMGASTQTKTTPHVPEALIEKAPQPPRKTQP
jgi:Tat protein translocase TatB subunit